MPEISITEIDLCDRAYETFRRKKTISKPVGKAMATAALKGIFSDEKSRSIHVCSHHPLGGSWTKDRGSSPTRKVTDFFLYKAFKIANTPRHLRHRCVPSQASNSFEFLAEAESF
jgi:hypothetical protein